MSANLLMVNPDPGPLAQELLDSGADILLLQEYSSRWDEALETVAARYPHRVGIVRDDSFGTAIYSRVPLLYDQIWEIDELPQTRVRVALGSGELEIWNVHVLPPRNLDYIRAHSAEMDLLKDALLLTDTPLLLGGDLNSPGFSPFSRAIQRKYDDAWDLAGDGPGATWPNGVFFLPPLRLDHLYLSRDLTVTEITRGTGAHSDHRPLLATVAPRVGGELCP